MQRPEGLLLLQKGGDLKRVMNYEMLNKWTLPTSEDI